MVFHADGFLVSFSFFSLSQHSSSPRYEKMMSKPPTDAIAVLHTLAHTHHLYTDSNVKKRRSKHELSVFYLRIIQNPHRTIFKWSGKEKNRRWNQQHQQQQRNIYSFLMLFSVIIIFYLFNDFCSRVANGQRYHTLTHTPNFEPWHAENFWFWIALRIVWCWLIQWGQASDFIAFIPYFCFVWCFFFCSRPKRQCDALWWENVEANQMECEKESSNLLQKTWQV